MHRSWRHVGTALAAAGIVGSARKARTHEVSPAEEQVFRAINDLPDEIHVPVWAVMQSGSLAGVFVVAGETLRRGRPRTAATTLVAGTAVWGGVKLVKPAIGRGRPAHHLAGVSVRGQDQTGLGYPSGHSAVALTVALAVTGASNPAIRAAAVGVAGVTGVARMYVGAHLPHDVVGGFGIGLLCGGAASGALKRWVAAGAGS
jgi:membrane-associated phospholipid phosphatase